MLSSARIRQEFLDFFSSKHHYIVPSAPIVVKNDPTLLFTNAGMNQFKDFFLGNKISVHKRVVDTQKCLRVSGKHNDLEEVGVDTYHHTMFEMLGNWSFGDYFKKEAIAYSWELLTNIFNIDKSRIYVTVFEGDENEGIPFDEEAYNEWKNWISEDRILKGSKKDNFWEMGEVGPCGPCSEIHVDCRSDVERQQQDGKALVNADHPQVIEIWNIVFIQFNRLKDSTLQALAQKHVDTGMGFERLVRVLQNKNSNYDTDIFTGTIAAVERISGKKYAQDDSKASVAFRVLADHIRAISFTIADGQLPSNVGAGYVIRRILRRAVRYYYSYLSYKKPLLYQLVSIIATQFEKIFPELKEQEAFVARVIQEEEEAFLRTLEKGLRKIDELMSNAQHNSIAGKEAFELYDTFGFPIDLTRLIAAENKLTVDEQGFEAEMQQQKNRSRQATTIDTDDWVMLQDNIEGKFVGYTDLQIKTQIAKYRKVKVKNKEQYQLVLQNTPFYPESGGQVGDRGTLSLNGKVINVVDTKKENELIIHITDELFPDMHGEITATVDFEKRLQTSRNHTATHLLHAALKKVVGSHVNQKGSLVNENLLRFDISHFSKLTEEELSNVTHLVNEKIRKNLPVKIEEMPKAEAMKKGAVALFGEKYGDKVRVVTIDEDFSVELCGGTHVSFTGAIGTFVITSESAVAAGVRRLEALTGEAAIRFLSQKVEENKEIAERLKSNDPLKAVEKLLQEKNELSAKVDAIQKKLFARLADDLVQKAEVIHNVHFVGAHIEADNSEALKKICFEMKPLLPQDYMVVLTTHLADKVGVVIMLSEALSKDKNLDAPKIIKEVVAPLIKGGGGGQKTLATAGGKDANQLDKVVTSVKDLLMR